MKTILVYICIIILSITAGIGALDTFLIYYPLSDGLNQSFISQLWYKKYWFPINSFGYRDTEPPASPLPGQKNIFIVGASFVAGQGIEHPADRFTDLIRQSLGEKYNVVMLARQGWYTTEEYHALEHFPYKPDVIVLCSTLYDIGGTIRRVTHKPLFETPHPTGLWIRSFALNFLYWRIYAINHFQSFVPYLNALYADPAIWQEYAKELNQFITYSERTHARLIVLLFPDLANPASSRESIGKVQSFFKMHQVETINLAPYLQHIHEPMIISNIDPHPNIALHRYLSELLLARLRDITKSNHSPQ